MPLYIIVIGTSCSGKSAFVNYFNKYFPGVYNDIDDYVALKEVFWMDDQIRTSQNPSMTIKNLKNQIKYSIPIWEQYNEGFNLKMLYTEKTEDEGHNILRPELWDYIITASVEKLKQSNNYIIQYSRGIDHEYQKAFNTSEEGPYIRSLKLISDVLSLNSKNTIIINVSANFDIRLERNKSRRDMGEHYVSEETMNKVYAVDIMQKYINSNYLKIGNNMISFYNIKNNKQLKSIDRERFFKKSINEIIRNYNLII